MKQVMPKACGAPVQHTQNVPIIDPSEYVPFLYLAANHISVCMFVYAFKLRTLLK